MSPVAKILDEILKQIQVHGSLLHNTGLASEENKDWSAVIANSKMILENTERALELLDRIRKPAEVNNPMQTAFSRVKKPAKIPPATQEPLVQLDLTICQLESMGTILTQLATNEEQEPDLTSLADLGRIIQSLAMEALEAAEVKNDRQTQETPSQIQGQGGR